VKPRQPKKMQKPPKAFSHARVPPSGAGPKGDVSSVGVGASVSGRGCFSRLGEDDLGVVGFGEDIVSCEFICERGSSIEWTEEEADAEYRSPSRQSLYTANSKIHAVIGKGKEFGDSRLGVGMEHLDWFRSPSWRR